MYLFQYALHKGYARKVLILDWDVHHGNGTQEIFYEVSFAEIRPSRMNEQHRTGRSLGGKLVTHSCQSA